MFIIVGGGKTNFGCKKKERYGPFRPVKLYIKNLEG